MNFIISTSSCTVYVCSLVMCREIGCYTCLLMRLRHENLLQYRESTFTSEIHYTAWPIKTCHFIFHFNSRIYWLFFTLYIPMETEINTLQNSYKMYNFILTMSSNAVWDDSGRPLPAVRSIELVVRNAENCPMFVFRIFVREFLDESSGKKPFRFPQFF